MKAARWASDAPSAAASAVSVNTALLSEQIGMCRICLEETDNRRLLRPCKCKGTQAYVHETCLDTWLKQKRDRMCETCMNEYEMEYRGLRPLRDWSWPRPASDLWEDEADFVCSFVWALIAFRVFQAWSCGGVGEFHTSLLAVFGSRRLVALWWFSFVVNSVYYKYVLCEVLQRWWEENSVYAWKDSVIGDRKKSSTTVTPPN